MIARVLVLLALSFAWVQPADDAARAWVQALRRPGLERPMHLASDAGKPLLAGGALVAVLAGAGGRAFLLEAGVALGCANVVVEGLRWSTQRTRPDGTHRRSNPAFPSSHAANAFAAAAIVVRRWRRAWPVALLAAATVAFSRMYLDRHWLSDVVAGAALGAGIAWGVAARWQAWRERRAAAA